MRCLPPAAPCRRPSREGQTPRGDRRARWARSARSAGPASRPARRGRRRHAPPRSPARRSSAERPDRTSVTAARLPCFSAVAVRRSARFTGGLSPSPSRAAPRGVARGLAPGHLARGETRADHASRSERLVRRAHAPSRDEQVVHVTRLERAERNVVRLPVRRGTRTTPRRVPPARARWASSRARRRPRTCARTPRRHA